MSKLTEIVSLVLSCDAAELTDEASPETIKTWDSVSQILLTSAVEQEFGVEFTDQEVVSIRKLGDIRALLQAKGIAA